MALEQGAPIAVRGMAGQSPARGEGTKHEEAGAGCRSSCRNALHAACGVWRLVDFVCQLVVLYDYEQHEHNVQLVEQ